MTAERSPEFRIAPNVSLHVGADELEIQGAAGGVGFMLPLRFLPLLARFSGWAELSSAFEEDAAGWEPWEALGVLRTLVERGVLVRKGDCAPDGGATPASRVWTGWGGPALAFHLASRTTADQPYSTVEELDRALAAKAEREPQPSAYKDYPAAEFTPLPDPRAGGGRRRSPDRFSDVLLHRRTCRAFSTRPVSKRDLATLLYLTWGATGVRPNRLGADVFVRKTSPSGGSLHATEVYPVVMNVDGVPSGVYHYSVRRHGLELLAAADPGTWIAQACGGQEWVRDAAVAFVSTSVLYRLAWKYRSPRALRVALQDTGHLSQTCGLCATWLGLGSFTTGALRDEIVERELGLDPYEEPVLLVNGVGWPAAA